MKRQRRFELFIALILAVICYFGELYLKEPTEWVIKAQSLTWQILNIFWLLAMIAFGYWGLSGHEFKWLKGAWLWINIIILIILFINKLFIHFWNHPFVPDSTSNLIRTPFFFLMAAYLPRWFTRYMPNEKQ